MRSLGRLRAIAVILPVALFAVWGVASWQLSHNSAIAVAEVRAELVRQYVLRVLEAQDMLLREAATLVGEADLDAMDEDSRRRLHERLAPLDDRLSHTLSVAAIDSTGRVVAASNHYPADLDVRDRTFFQERETIGDVPHVSRVELRPTGVDALLVSRWQRPVAEDRGFLIVAAAGIETLSPFLAQLANSESSAAVLVSSDGTILVRQDAGDDPIRLAADSMFMQSIREAERGFYRTRAVADGVTRMYAYTKVDPYPLYAAYGVPQTEILSGWGRQLALVGVLLAIVGGFGYALVMQFERRLKAERARERNAIARERMDAMRKSAERSQLMLEEAHHRIKNSLQLVSSFISLGRREKGDADQILMKVSERVLAISAVHDLLYENNMSGAEVDLVTLMRRVSESPGLTPSDADVTIHFDSTCESATIPASTAVSITLVVVELIINSGKHAFAGRSSGRIMIHLDVEDDAIMVTVADDGVGLPDVGEASRSSGLRLVDGILRQLGGTLERHNEGGARFVLTVGRFQKASSSAGPVVAA